MRIIGRKLFIDRRGDTLVEVIIAMAIVSVVLAGSYAITSRNLSITQGTNERSQAQQLVQKQIELLRVFSQKGGTAIAAGCLTDDGVLTTKCDIAPGNTSAGDTNPDCSSYCYTLNISPQKDASGANIPGIYNVHISWPSLTGTNSTLNMSYGPPTL
jgi:prepilin-type N-terminal cleavage/methylation domain-containing protein